MSEYLHKNIVLVLNANWQAVNTTTPICAFNRLSGNSAVALHVASDEDFYPVPWEDWINLDVRSEDLHINTPSRKIRIPQVIIAKRFSKVPMKEPAFNKAALYKRQRGRCWYTNKVYDIDEMNMDHVVPRSKGGKTSWDNCVLTLAKINHRKADRTPEQAGLTKGPALPVPRPVPVSTLISNDHGVRDWDLFVQRSLLS